MECLPALGRTFLQKVEVVAIVVDDCAVMTDETIVVETEDLHRLVMIKALGGGASSKGMLLAPPLFRSSRLATTCPV